LIKNNYFNEGKMEKNFVREYRHAVSQKNCLDLIFCYNEYTNSNLAVVSSGSEENGGPLNRLDHNIILERALPSRVPILHEALQAAWQKYCEDFPFLQNTQVISYTFKMQKTPPGGGFHTWHWEHNPQHLNRNRLAVWTLYLTEHEEGGETEFLAYGLRVKPEVGKLCIFPADYTGVHRGNPIYDKDKYIVTGWFEYYDG